MFDGGSAVQDEVGAIGAEHLGRVALRFDRRADVDQQIAEVDVGVAQIVAEDLLAEVLEEQLARGRLAIELAALVPGAREGDVRFGVVGHEPAEERRQQARAVFGDARDHLLGVEGGRLLTEEDAAVDFADHVRRQRLRQPARIREHPQRRVEAGAAHRAHQLARRLEPIAVDRGDVGADGGVFEHVAVVAIADLDLEPLGRRADRAARASARSFAIDERDHLQQLVEGDRNRRRLDAYSIIASLRRTPAFAAAGLMHWT